MCTYDKRVLLAKSGNVYFNHNSTLCVPVARQRLQNVCVRACVKVCTTCFEVDIVVILPSLQQIYLFSFFIPSGLIMSKSDIFPTVVWVHINCEEGGKKESHNVLFTMFRFFSL